MRTMNVLREVAGFTSEASCATEEDKGTIFKYLETFEILDIQSSLNHI